jgi:aldehyde dehydrogenase (NAD+)
VLFGDVPPDHVLAQEEVFGPVLVAIRVRDEADALRVANGAPYGLVSGIWTKEIGRASRKLKSGRFSSTITAPAAEQNYRSKE